MYWAKLIRTTAYALVALLLPVYLSYRSLTSAEIGVVIAAVAVGNLGLTLLAPKLVKGFGFKRLVSALPLTMSLGGFILLFGQNFYYYILGSLIGSFSISQTEAGVFLVLDQTLLPELVEQSKKNSAFSLYNLVGYLGTMLGASLTFLSGRFLTAGSEYTVLFAIYMGAGVAVSLAYWLIKTERGFEVLDSSRNIVEVAKSNPLITGLAALFGLDAFAGGLTVQSWIAYWFFIVYHLQLGELGGLFVLSNGISAASLLVAGRLADRFGVVKVMVLSHLPSNLLLMAIPFAGNVLLAVALLLCRQSLSQMDVPTRQVLVVSIVSQSHRAGAASLTTATRSVAQIAGTPITGLLLQSAYLSEPFIFSGLLKSIYDVSVLILMRKHLFVGKKAKRIS
jgi:MFS family permease